MDGCDVGFAFDDDDAALAVEQAGGGGVESITDADPEPSGERAAEPGR